jgi:hypothetical protein
LFALHDILAARNPGVPSAAFEMPPHRPEAVAASILFARSKQSLRDVNSPIPVRCQGTSPRIVHLHHVSRMDGVYDGYNGCPGTLLWGWASLVQNPRKEMEAR